MLTTPVLAVQPALPKVSTLYQPKPANLSLTTSRQIKAQPFCWQALNALDLLRQHYEGHKRGAALLLYNALTELASRQRTPHQAKTSCRYLAEQVGLSDQTARRYLHEFAELGLVKIVAGIHAANTYILLGELAVDLSTEANETPTTPLHIVGSRTVMADRAASIKAQEAITNASPQHRRAVMADRPTSLRAITADSQYSTSKDSNKLIEQPTNNGGDVGKGSEADERAEQPASQPPFAAPNIYSDKAVAVNALCRLGIRRTTAEQLAGQHQVERITGWTRYASGTSGLKNPAGFVLSRLKAGDPAPSPADRFAGYIPAMNLQPESAPCGLLLADELPPQPESAPCGSLLPDEPLQPEFAPCGSLLPNEPPPQPESTPCGSLPPEQVRHSYEPASAWMQSVWSASEPDLRKLVSEEVWRSWLQQVRLIGCDGDTWVLRVPPGNVSRTLIERWGEQIMGTLSVIYGKAVSLRFTTRG